MPRKIALSFLGTNDYIDCHYYLESTPAEISSPVKYMQEALVDLICTSGIDVFYVFVTEEPEKPTGRTMATSTVLAKRPNQIPD